MEDSNLKFTNRLRYFIIFVPLRALKYIKISVYS